MYVLPLEMKSSPLFRANASVFPGGRYLWSWDPVMRLPAQSFSTGQSAGGEAHFLGKVTNMSVLVFKWVPYFCCFLGDFLGEWKSSKIQLLSGDYCIISKDPVIKPRFNGFRKGPGLVWSWAHMMWPLKKCFDRRWICNVVSPLLYIPSLKLT